MHEIQRDRDGQESGFLGLNWLGRFEVSFAGKIVWHLFYRAEVMMIDFDILVVSY